MRELVSYTCSTCAGALIVDRKQKVFECPFCGNAFDVVSLHRKELLADAAVNMQQMEFNAAKEKFESVLESEPHDVEALRGLLLCGAGVPSINSLSTPYKVKVDSLESIKQSLPGTAERAGEEGSAYFYKMTELADLADECLTVKDERERFPKAVEKAFQDMSQKRNTRTLVYSGLFFIGAVISACLFCFNDPVLGIICALICIGSIALVRIIDYFLIEMKQKDKYSEIFADIHHDERVVDARLSAAEEAYDRVFRELQAMDPAAGVAQTPVFRPQMVQTEE